MKSLLVESDREEILTRIGRVGPDTERQWGRMSAHGMVCHLTDSFLGVLGDRPIRDLSNPFARTVMRWVALSTPMPWPRGVATAHEVDQERGGTPPGDFDADLRLLLDVTATFMERLDPATMRHPVFGTLSEAEWGRWAYRHVDHHTRQFGL